MTNEVDPFLVEKRLERTIGSAHQRPKELLTAAMHRPSTGKSQLHHRLAARHIAPAEGVPSLA
jgi:hypothetical protein